MSVPAVTATQDAIPRVLLIANFLSEAGGSRSVLEDLVERLRGRAPEIVLASHYRWGLLRGLHMAATAIVRRLHYDVAMLDLYSGRAFLWGETMGRLLKVLGCPFVLTLRGGLLPDFAKRHPRRVSACLSRADIVAAPSGFLLENMRPFTPNIVLLPNPLDLDRYAFTLRRSPKPKLVWLRSFHEVYDPCLAVHVLSTLVKDFPDVTLTMVGADKGDGSWQRVDRLAIKCGVRDRLTMPGKVAKKDVPNWLNQSDIFLNTTTADNAPVSVLEAMACGLCVVTTNAGGLPFLVEDQVDALLVPPHDPVAMVRAVRRLLSEPALAEALSAAGRRKAEQYAWSAQMQHWETILRSVSPKWYLGVGGQRGSIESPRDVMPHSSEEQTSEGARHALLSSASAAHLPARGSSTH